MVNWWRLMHHHWVHHLLVRLWRQLRCFLRRMLHASLSHWSGWRLLSLVPARILSMKVLIFHHRNVYWRVVAVVSHHHMLSWGFLGRGFCELRWIMKLVGRFDLVSLRTALYIVCIIVFILLLIVPSSFGFHCLLDFGFSDFLVV